MKDVLGDVQFMADEYRRLHRLHDDYPVEVFIPDWYAQKLINAYGSLQAAVDTIFRPGAVKLVNEYWDTFHRKVQVNLENRAQLERKRVWFQSDIADLTRIALNAD